MGELSRREMRGNAMMEGGNMRKFFVFGLVAVLVLAFLCSACAPGPNSAEKTPNAEGKVAGFFKGFWHGLISPITFIISIFTKNVRMYEVHNNGIFYNFGFVLGAGLFLGGGILGHKKCR
jgi:hypothetical protein